MALQKDSIRVQLELDDIDITRYLLPNASLSIEKNRDFPNFGIFNTSSLSIPILNASGEFDPGEETNFFTRQGRNRDGYGSRLLVILTKNGTDQLRITGELIAVQQTLNSSIATLSIRDLSLRLRTTKIEGFGQQVTRRITDYPEANADYEVSQFHFSFPEGLTPILRGSVTASIVVNDVSQSIEIVEAFTSSGTFSYRRATVDYENGVLQLEAMPPDGNSSVIDATWNISHRYKRPDFLVREIIGTYLFRSLPDYAIESIIFESPTDTYSSHGRPFVEESGIVRYLKRNPADKSIWMAHQNSLLRYDEAADTYTKIATTPDDPTITEVPPGGYGAERQDARIRVPTQSLTQSSLSYNYNTVFRFIKVRGSQLYALETSLFTTRRIYTGGARGLAISESLAVFSTDPIGIRSATEYYLSRDIGFNLPLSGSGSSLIRTEVTEQSYTRRRIGISDFDIYDNYVYCLETISSVRINGRSTAAVRVQKYPIANLDPAETTQNRESITGEETVFTITQDGHSCFAVSQTRIYLVTGATTIKVYNHSGTLLPSEGFSTTGENRDGITAPIIFSSIAVVGNLIYGLHRPTQSIYVYNTSGERQRFLDFTLEQNRDYLSISIENNVLYALRVPERLYQYGRRSMLNAVPANAFVDSYSLLNILNYQSFAIFQFDTIDFNTFYCLCTNTAKGDITQDSAFNSNRVLRYVRSTNTWTTLLDQTGGYPQIAEQFDFISQGQILADNRKNFQIIRYNSIDYIFFRRVKGTTSELAFFNTSNSLIGTVQSFSTTATTNQGREWSTDFIMETRSDNSIWSYFFMVNYNLQSGVFNGGHLQIIARRVFPSFFASSRFHVETFASTLTTYPISVSGVVLANDKLYFVLDYRSEGTTVAGKAELCVIPKAGGTRTVLKTYDDPLLGPRSPAVIGTSVYYLEGGSIRRIGTTDANDLYYYPNEGGKLIEIQSDNTIVDHGIIWRSGKVLDSPDPEIADRRYDGWGLHNSIPSNMIVGSGDTLNFIAGFGNPFRTAENLPSTNPIVIDADPGNFNWIQYGKELSTKIEEADLEGTNYWAACTQLATLTDAEIGFSPDMDQVSTYLVANPTANIWEAWSTIFMRSRTVGTGQLNQALTSGATITSLVLDDTNLNIFNSTGGRVVIDNEIIRYTSATETTSSNQVTLSGISRAYDSTVAADHLINTRVYPLKLLLQDTDASLINITSKTIDVSNRYNVINITHGGEPITRIDTVSRNQFGEKVLSVSAPFLNDSSLPWLEILANRYLERFKNFKNVVEANIPINPTVELGDVVVLKIRRGFISDYETFEVMRVSHSLTPQAIRTSLTLRGL